MLQEEIEKRLGEILGPKTEADNAKPVKKKKEKPTKVEVCQLSLLSSLRYDCLNIVSVSTIFNDMQEVKTVAAPPSEEELNPYSIFPQPEENFKVW